LCDENILKYRRTSANDST